MFDHDVRQLCEDLNNHRKIGLRLLGSGNFANVYAHPVRNDIAIKVVQNNVADDGYRDYVDYALGTLNVSLFPKILFRTGFITKRNQDIEVYVLERLHSWGALNKFQRMSCNVMRDAILDIHEGWHDQSNMSTETIEKRFALLQRHYNAHTSIERLNEDQLREYKALYVMLCTLNDQKDFDWGIGPDIGSSNMMFRIIDDNTAQCVVTDPVACGDWMPTPVGEEDYI